MAAFEQPLRVCNDLVDVGGVDAAIGRELGEAKASESGLDYSLIIIIIIIIITITIIGWAPAPLPHQNFSCENRSPLRLCFLLRRRESGRHNYTLGWSQPETRLLVDRSIGRWSSSVWERGSNGRHGTAMD